MCRYNYKEIYVHYPTYNNFLNENPTEKKPVDLLALIAVKIPE